MAASEGVDLEWCIIKYLGGDYGDRKFSSKIEEQGKACAQNIKKFAGARKIQAWHSDDSKGPFGSIYAKPEPKTDIVLKIGSTIYTTSVKMAGPIQLASGQGASTAELFESAADNLKNDASKRVLKSIVKELKVMPTRLLSMSNYDRIVEEGNPKIVSEFIKNGKILKDKSYEYWLENNKPELLGALLKFVKQNPEYYNAILLEALTGKQTLASYRGAVANSIVSPVGFFIINDQYVSSIKQKVKMDLRAKSRGGISSVAFRIETKG
jgi:hypothetical protein